MQAVKQDEEDKLKAGKDKGPKRRKKKSKFEAGKKVRPAHLPHTRRGGDLWGGREPQPLLPSVLTIG